MKRKTKWLAALLAVGLAIGIAGCGQNPAKETSETSAAKTAKKVLRVGASFAYPSLDAHKEYYGWFTSLYGITETLFKIADDSSIQPWLAESAQTEGNTWTIQLKQGVTFSNGKVLDAQMVIRNLQRAAQENSRFSFLADFTYDTPDAQTVTITSQQPYPTMLNTLACPELGMMDLEAGSFDTQAVGTGPFTVETFEPEGTVTVIRNPNYWDGDVQLDQAIFYYIPDDAARLMAMQNGEIDCDNSVTAAAKEVFEKAPDQYQLTSVPASRLQFYILNQETLPEPVRKAIHLTIDSEAMAEYLDGTVTPTAGPFSAEAAYGKAVKTAVDPEQAKELLEAEGFALNGEGYYEKEGRQLTVRIAYYAARSLDTLAALMQEQLKQVGIQAALICEEDPDATYIASHDFDLALYCMIADQSGDPEYFIDSTLKEGSYFDVGGFNSDECEGLIQQLDIEMDRSKRAELANQIIQLSLDKEALGYIALFNKITVLKTGVSGFAETSPFDFYGLSANTDIESSGRGFN